MSSTLVNEARPDTALAPIATTPTAATGRAGDRTLSTSTVTASTDATPIPSARWSPWASVPSPVPGVAAARSERRSTKAITPAVTSTETSQAGATWPRKRPPER